MKSPQLGTLVAVLVAVFGAVVTAARWAGQVETRLGYLEQQHVYYHGEAK